jgi:thioredoxin-like negative regulator of GroEL
MKYRLAIVLAPIVICSAPVIAQDVYAPPGQALYQHPACQPVCGVQPPVDIWAPDRRIDDTTRNIVEAGVGALHERDFDRAAHNLAQAREREPENSQIGFLLAGALYSGGEFDQAQPLLKQLLQERNRLTRKQRTLLRSMLQSTK